MFFLQAWENSRVEIGRIEERNWERDEEGVFFI